MQTRTDSLMEAVCNTAVGFTVSLVTQFVMVWVFDFNLSASESVTMVTIFTVVSVIRQYVLRRLFNGRSVWAAIKAEVSA